MVVVGGVRGQCYKLQTHFRETHLLPLSSPDGKNSLSQDPAGCHAYWKYTLTHMNSDTSTINANVYSTHRHRRTHTLTPVTEVHAAYGFSDNVRTNFSTCPVLL